MPAQVRIIGLPEFQSAVNRLKTTDLAKELLPHFVDFASEVAQRGRGLANTPQMRRAAPAIQAHGPVISVGGTPVWAMGALFGSDRYKQFPPAVKGGYTIFPAMHQIGGEYLTRYERVIEEVCREAFPS